MSDDTLRQGFVAIRDEIRRLRYERAILRDAQLTPDESLAQLQAADEYGIDAW